MKKAYLASGCFWCTETIFDNVDGVTKVIPGYMGGTKTNPTYEEVCTGLTGHAELVEITYDSNLVSFKKLFNKKVPKKPKGRSIPTKRILVFKFRDLIFFKLEPKNRVGLQNIRN